MTEKWRCFHKNNMFATCKIVIFWGGHFFGHFVDFLSFLVILGQSCQKYWKVSKIIRKITEKKDKIMTMSREKCHFCNLQNCHFLSFFGTIFVKNMEIYSKNDSVSRKNDNVSWKNDNVSWKMRFLQPAKWQKNKQNDTKTHKKNGTNTTIKMTDKIDMTQKWQTKLTWQKIDKQNDRQNWNDKKNDKQMTEKSQQKRQKNAKLDICFFFQPLPA